MPKLWTETIETHRREVRDATLDTTAALVAKHGLLSVTMSRIAEETGIGRATLYKYFPDVEAIVVAWHERQIASHLERLVRARDQAGDAAARLQAVLEEYALINHERGGTQSSHDRHGAGQPHQHQRDELRHGQHGSELAALMHRGHHVARAEQQLRRLIQDVLNDGARAGAVRTDVDANELASYCLHALTAATNLSSKAAVRRLVSLTLAGLRPDR